MVCHGVEIERAARDGHVKAGRVLDRFAAGEAVGIIRGTPDIEDVGIKAGPCMDVQIAEIGVAIRIVSGHVAICWRGVRCLHRRHFRNCL